MEAGIQIRKRMALTHTQLEFITLRFSDCMQSSFPARDYHGAFFPVQKNPNFPQNIRPTGGDVEHSIRIVAEPLGATMVLCDPPVVTGQYGHLPFTPTSQFDVGQTPGVFPQHFPIPIAKFAHPQTTRRLYNHLRLSWIVVVLPIPQKVRIQNLKRIDRHEQQCYPPRASERVHSHFGNRPWRSREAV